MIPCPSPIKSVKLTMKQFVKKNCFYKFSYVIVLEDKIFVFDSNDLKEEPREIETGPNTRGICQVSNENSFLVYPSPSKGSFCIYNLHSNTCDSIKAHESDIACISLSNDGKLIATASEKGTLIRIFDVNTKLQIKEVRRGSSKADIFSIAFSFDNSFLCTCSSSGTLHVFSIGSFQYVVFNMVIY